MRRTLEVPLIVTVCRNCGKEIRNTRILDNGWQHTWNLNSACYPPEQFPGMVAAPQHRHWYDTVIAKLKGDGQWVK